jgi:hypothetical protein
MGCTQSSPDSSPAPGVPAAAPEKTFGKEKGKGRDTDTSSNSDGLNSSTGCGGTFVDTLGKTIDVRLRPDRSARIASATRKN